MAHEQAKALLRLGHEVRMFAGDLGTVRQRHTRDDDVHESVPYCRIATKPEDYSPEFLNFLHPQIDHHFCDVLTGFVPDVVHCHNLIGLSAKLPILASDRGAAVLCTVHDFWGFCLRNTAIRADGRRCDDISQCGSCLPRLHDGRELDVPLRFRRDMLRLAFGQVDRFVAPSRFIADRYAWAGLQRDRIVVLPNGIDTVRFSPRWWKTERHPVRIAYVGYLGAHKGVATLINALARLPDRTITLQLAGEGPEEATSRALAEALNIGERVDFLGKISPAAMPDVYARSDIVVLPSIWDENQPVCLMEAMAAGLPVVASRVGGTPELIDHGTNGLLFAAGDASDLARQLTRLAEDFELRKAMGDAGRRRVEALSHDRQAERLLEYYRESIGERGTPARSAKILRVPKWKDQRSADANWRLDRASQDARLAVPVEWIADCRVAAEVNIPATQETQGSLRLTRDLLFKLLRLLRRCGSAVMRRIRTSGR